jgi:hypothetical protein
MGYVVISWVMIFVVVILLYYTKRFNKKTERMVKELDFILNLPGETDIFNVEKFNEWFCDPNNGATYAHTGIFLRLDKLSADHIFEYLEKRYGIKYGGPFLWSKPTIEMLGDFEEEIRKDWRTKLNEK